MPLCIGYSWVNRFQLNNGAFESTAPVGVAQAATMKDNLLPEGECKTCSFKCPSDEWKNVWWAVRSLLRLWRMSRRVVLTRNIEWQKKQTQFVTPLSYLYDSCVSLLIGPSGDTPTGRHFSSRYPHFLTKCNEFDVLVRDHMEKLIVDDYLCFVVCNQSQSRCSSPSYYRPRLSLSRVSFLGFIPERGVD